MAGQSITFDFLTTGADRTASGFRKVGDNTVLAARGAKVLADAIEKLGKKEDRTAAESKILAGALRQTGDAEDRVAARAVLADAAVRRLDDALKDSAKDSRKARAEADGLGKTLGGLKLNPGLLGPAIALAPAIASLGGVAAGAAAGLGGAFIAGGAALAAFGAVAKPVLSDAKKAAGAVEKAQNNYNAAIAGGTKQSVAYKAEQIAIAKAYAGLSPAQIALSKQLGTMASAWQAVKASQTPVVAGALQPWLRSVTDLTKNLAPIIAKIAPVIGYLGTKFDSLVNSSAFKGFRDFIANTGSKVVGAVGGTLIDFVKAFMILLPKFNPLILKMTGGIAGLGPAVLKWANSKKAADDITKFMGWFSKNGHVVGDLLKNIGGALKALAPGLAAGGAEEVKILSGFFGLIAKLPPSLAKPLAEVAGALLILNKLGVVSVGVKLIGMNAAAAAAGGGAVGMWGKLLPGVRLAGGVLVAAVVVDTVLKNTSSGAGKNWLDNPFGQGTFKDPKTGKQAGSPSWLTSWPTAFKGSIAGKIAGLFHRTTASIQADFAAQGKAATNAAADVGVLAAAITHNGNASAEAHTARAALISDMEKAGVKSATAQADVVSYSNAVTANGVNSSQAAGARRRLISDILATSSNARLGRDDLAAYTVAVQSQGSRSDAARAARARLIKDLENSGLSAKGAQALVDGLQRSIDGMHGKNVPIGVTGSGKGGVVITTSGIAAAGQGNVRFTSGNAAQGLYVNRGTGPTADDVLIRASRGELIVPTNMVRAGAVDHLRGRIPGFAAGGFAGAESALGSMVGVASGIEGRGAAAAMAAGVKAAIAREKAALKAAGGASGSAIADYAMSWLGKIPYVWGGTAVPGGADCSGFTGAVYRKFGISAPRTSEAQGAWVHRSGPVPGSLAFYHSPAGGPDPGHVAVVRSASQVISQGGGMGPTLIGLHALPLLWTGVPPGGLPSGGGGGVANTGQMSAAAIARLWTADGGPAWAASNMAAIANAESGDRPGAVQTGQPPGRTGWGLYQITPTSGISQNGAFGNLLNASNNTRAAISLFAQSGYGPWASDPVGRGLAAAPFGFASGGLAGQGAAYLRAWQTRHGGGYGAAWGPVTVNRQIDAMTAAQHRAAILSRAPGLSAGQHRHYAAVAADEKKRVAALISERGTERSWRTMLGVSDASLTASIRAAGSTKSLAKNVTGWKSQLARQKATIGNISAMLGLSAAQVAAAQKAGTLGPGGAALPAVTHTYGGDITNTIGAFLSSVAAPFGAARGGLVFDRGGWLKPGWNATYNGTGRPEHLLPARGGSGGDVHLHVHGPVGSQAELEQWLTAAIRKGAKTRGGGSVERAYGAH